MNQNLVSRREVMKMASAGILTAPALGALVIVEEGCNIQQWIQTALNDLPAVIQVITSIINIVGAYSKSGVDQTVIDKATAICGEVNTGLQLASSIITQYETAAAGAKPGLLSQIDTALTVAIQNVNQVLALVGGTSIANDVSAALGS